MINGGYGNPMAPRAQLSFGMYILPGPVILFLWKQAHYMISTQEEKNPYRKRYTRYEKQHPGKSPVTAHAFLRTG